VRALGPRGVTLSARVGAEWRPLRASFVTRTIPAVVVDEGAFALPLQAQIAVPLSW
jgi:hypothetical protein